jgi:hypothetical protein
MKAIPIGVVVSLLGVGVAIAQADRQGASNVVKGNRIYQTDPGTNNIRHDKPSLVLKGTRLYQMDPGTNNIRYDKPSYVIDGDTTYKTYPGRSDRDYGAPAYKAQ